jgi:L-alanine-DL-glutamate epimerase-like enolase superfamily enzyme
VLEAKVDFFHQPFLKPLQISSGKITEITEARAQVRVRVNGREAVGHGSIYLSDLWAWPEPSLTHDQRDAVLRDLCKRIEADLWNLCGGEEEHPLELGLRLHNSLCHGASDEGPSILARAMCASPFDAAIHDGVGQTLGLSAFDFYTNSAPIPSADSMFAGGSACEAIRSIIRPPLREFDAWLIVSRGDSLEEAVAPWVRERGYHAFKVKILGRDNADDAARTAEVFQAVRAFGVAKPRLTVDSNEANPNAASVLDYLQRLRALDEDAFAALEYLEQPTARDIIANPNDWRQVTRLKPVLLDEGLTSFDVLDEAVAQGWSGLALKTCKGHSFALVAAAWALSSKLHLSLQDLTNPGLSAIHAALFAAHVPTVNGVEMNSPQYTPAANAEWLPRLSALLEPKDGLHRLPDAIPAGLGSTL